MLEKVSGVVKAEKRVFAKGGVVCCLFKTRKERKKRREKGREG